MGAPLLTRTPEQDRAYRREVRRQLDVQNGISHTPVPVGPVVEHVRQLRELGFTEWSIANAADRTVNGLRLTLAGTHERMRRDAAHRILSLTPQTIFAQTTGTAWVPMFATRRRIVALHAIGWRSTDITEATNGIVWPNMTARANHIKADAHHATRELFERWQLTPGPSEQTRKRALSKGWHPPLAWDDPDDPTQDPDSLVFGEGIDPVAVETVLEGRRVPLNETEQRLVEEILTGRGVSAGVIGSLLGVSSRTVHRWRKSRQSG